MKELCLYSIVYILCDLFLLQAFFDKCNTFLMHCTLSGQTSSAHKYVNIVMGPFKQFLTDEIFSKSRF